jgi:hypothetical protein
MVANIPPRKDINHGMVAAKPAGGHISPAVRAALKEQDPEIAKHVREVADSR